MIQAILYPVFIQIALTFVLMYWLGFVRVRSARAGEVKLKDILHNTSAWPEHVTKIGNAFANQFQVPILFYVLVGLALITQQVNATMVLLAWVFVALRVLHAYIHVFKDNILQRLQIFAMGATVLLIMWIHFAVQLHK